MGAVEVVLGRKRGLHFFPLACSDAVESLVDLTVAIGATVAVTVADGAVVVVYWSP